MAITAGYDVGGAHLKVALAEDGRTIAVRQIPCPLWRGMQQLDAALVEAVALIARAEQHAVTMTGELCELFPDRQTGVREILSHLATELDADLRVYMGLRGFADTATAMAEPASVGSMNFLASAALVARTIPDALLIDMGSTTTDIIPVVGGTPCPRGPRGPRGLTDGDRLRTGELVYTGLTRTDVSVVAQRASLGGIEQRLAAGGFANMADVRRILGELPDGRDQHATLDGRGTSVEESVARFARCFGRDAADASLEDWRSAARDIAGRQLAEVRAAIDDVLAASPVSAGAPIVAAGIGAAQVDLIAQALGRQALRLGTLANAAPDCAEWATRCAPAVAVALLAQGV
jgi:probable H4MPT-linked C1 transfer pathway protein